MYFNFIMLILFFFNYSVFQFEVFSLVKASEGARDGQPVRRGVAWVCVGQDVAGRGCRG